MRFTFAHFSDPHLPLPAGTRLRSLLNKRWSGFMSWRGHRRHVHLPEILAAAVADMRVLAPDHLVITGDLVNIALPGEFVAARRWLEGLGAPSEVTLVPGNHDATVTQPWARALGQWEPWMRGDEASGGAAQAALFPSVRRRGPVAFIGLCTALPTPLFMASGRLGADQLARLEGILAGLKQEGLFRCVLLHHPPVTMPGGGGRKGLVDRRGLQAVLGRVGAELLLHGHTHRSRLDWLAGPTGPIPSMAVPSASALPSSKDHARWHFCAIERQEAGWRVEVQIRGLAPGARHFEAEGRFHLTVPRPDMAVSGAA